MIRRLLVCALLTVTLTGCASMLGNVPVQDMTAKQLQEFAKIKDANVTCLIVNSPYGKGMALFLSLDKAVIPAGSVSVDDNCVLKLITGPAPKTP